MTDGPSISESLRHELAQGDLSLASARPVLRHLLTRRDEDLLGDEIVARIRGMLRDCAHHLLRILDTAGDRQGPVTSERIDELQDLLMAEEGIVGHVHALAVEMQVTDRVAARSGIDPVLSPVVQQFAASADEVLAASAMQVLAAQARFVQRAARMALHPREMPPELFNRAVQLIDEVAEDFDVAEAAVTMLRSEYDERHTRYGRFAHLLAAAGDRRADAAAIDGGGVSLFASAVAQEAGIERDLVVLSLADRQFARLALTLRAAGIGQEGVREQFFYLHPDIAVPDALTAIPVDQARAMLDGAELQDLL